MDQQDTTAVFDNFAAAFYLREIIRHAMSGLQAADAMCRSVEQQSRPQPAAVFGNARIVASEAAMISKILWPSPAKRRSDEGEREFSRRQTLSSQRGPFLLNLLGVPAESPLKNRRVRNAIEHFDERLDRQLSVSPRIIVDENIGPPDMISIGGKSGVFHLNHYDPVTTVYTVLDASISIKEVSEALHGLLHSAVEASAKIDSSDRGAPHV